MSDSRRADDERLLALRHLEYLVTILPPGKGAYTSVNSIRRYIANSTPDASAGSEKYTPAPKH